MGKYILDDDDLVEMIKKGDTHAEALLCEKYWGFAKKFGRRFAVLYLDLGVTEDEFASVAFASIVTAIKKYAPGKGEDAFKKYWIKIAKNQCVNYVHDNLLDSLDFGRPLSLDSSSYDDGLTLHEICTEKENEIMDYIDQVQLEDLLRSPKSPFSDDEAIVVYYVFMRGYSIKDLMLLTKWTKAKAYHIVKNARKKVSNFFKSGYFK